MLIVFLLLANSRFVLRRILRHNLDRGKQAFILSLKTLLLYFRNYKGFLAIPIKLESRVPEVEPYTLGCFQLSESIVNLFLLHFKWEDFDEPNRVSLSRESKKKSESEKKATTRTRTRELKRFWSSEILNQFLTWQLNLSAPIANCLHNHKRIIKNSLQVIYYFLLSYWNHQQTVTSPN